MCFDYSDQQKNWQVIRKLEGSAVFLALINLNLFHKLQLKKERKKERRRHSEKENNSVCWNQLSGCLPALLTKEDRNQESKRLCKLLYFWKTKR
jgi:hypothetical protein